MKHNVFYNVTAAIPPDLEAWLTEKVKQEHTTKSDFLRGLIRAARVKDETQQAGKNQISV